MSSSVAKLHGETKWLSGRFTHGGSIESAAAAWECAAAEILDLSTGLHPAGAPAWLGEWLREHALLAGRYPDPHGEPARATLAAEFGVAADNVLIIAGAQALIEVVFQAMEWRSLAIGIPCYNEPIRCAERAGCILRPFADSDSIPAADALWWTSPANPSGVAAPFPAGRSGLLDESYMPFAERRSLGLLGGVIRLGSLTKSLCIPGLRLGYAIADAACIERLRHWLPPWPASTLALHLLPKLLKEADERDAQVAAARSRLIALLERNGWEVLPSQASFVLAQPQAGMPDFSAARIMVRTFPEWPQLSGWVRFGLPGGEQAWQRLEEVICR